ncbi:hypothetical protein SAMN05443662_1330 [Sulfurivirga caldicuralii]|uniref:PcfJ-like protein n=1 Tax=Sulfurivirga caldicuralii TaxID=364032 RepID=A0A1N6GGG4_9GAMM|nr:hypothetical protein [Sulfurivirga caldicuralii]SIO06629.1 hypothetical protein SAMN05443662_1330 [Sulfurivirga caldicuralii]
MTNASALRTKILHDSRPALWRLLSRHSLWDEETATLWVDLTPFDSKLQPVAIPGWERMLTWHGETPELPAWAVLAWPNTPAVHAWRRQIPAWVRDTLQRLPNKGQLRLLFLSARYPQMLELLDKMPVLAWRLANANMDEHQLEQLFPRPRTDMTGLIGWPEDRRAIRFLQKLRLRSMDEQMLQQIDTCLADPTIYHRATELPRINSMALTLAANFPQLIGSQLHQSLARQPCRPQQCQQMKALLQDAIELANWLGESLDPIKSSRFLVEVEEIHTKWLQKGLKRLKTRAEQSGQKMPIEKVGDPPPLPAGWQLIRSLHACNALCQTTGHAWFTQTTGLIVRPRDKTTPWAAQIDFIDGHWQLGKGRQAGNRLLDSEQLAQCNLLLTYLNAHSSPTATASPSPD